MLRLSGRTVQIKTPQGRPVRWAPAGYAVARHYLAIAQLPLPGTVTALRSLVGRNGMRPRHARERDRRGGVGVRGRWTRRESLSEMATVKPSFRLGFLP